MTRAPETYETCEQLLVRMVVLRRKIEETKGELRDVRREMAKRRRAWKWKERRSLERLTAPKTVWP